MATHAGLDNDVRAPSTQLADSTDLRLSYSVIFAPPPPRRIDEMHLTIKRMPTFCEHSVIAATRYSVDFSRWQNVQYQWCDELF